MKTTIRIFNKEFYLPFFQKISKAVSSFSLTEKVIFTVFAIILIGTSLSMLLRVNNQLLTEVPRFGGTLEEGLIDTPRFINPLLALSETDRDLTALIYSGLMRITPEGGLIPDLAESVEISEDGTEYLFKIRDDAFFHNGEPVTSDDVIFTILKAQDPTIKSSKIATWDGIVIERLGDKEILFILNQPYSPFLNNTTLGILPSHIWQNISSEEFSFSQFNTEPIGSGPYKIKEVLKNKSGIAELYTLSAFDKFTLGKPNIKNIEFKFYTNENSLISALKEGSIDSINSISTKSARDLDDNNFNVLQFPLPRIFGVFFNQSKAPVLVSKSVRKALDTAIDRNALIDSILGGYAQEARGPIPPSLIPFETLSSASSKEPETGDEESEKLEDARNILTEAGWEINEEGFLQKESKSGTELLTFSLTTVNVPELVKVAEHVAETWRELGADVNVKIFDSNDLNQNVIRSRNYDAFLFGEIIGRDLDFYAFWHSSQRNDPGLNIADYANITVDKLLEDARGLSESPERIEKFIAFDKEIQADIPAIFLYSPDFVYVVPDKLKGIVPDNITIPSERFASVYNWYLETDTVWKFFK